MLLRNVLYSIYGLLLIGVFTSCRSNDFEHNLFLLFNPYQREESTLIEVRLRAIDLIAINEICINNYGDQYLKLAPDSYTLYYRTSVYPKDDIYYYHNFNLSQYPSYDFIGKLYINGTQSFRLVAYNENNQKKNELKWDDRSHQISRLQSNSQLYQDCQ